MPPDHIVQPNVYSSPKRKRDAAEPSGYLPSSLPLTPSLNTDLPVHLVPEDRGILPGDGSPRTAVAGRFQNLHIQSTGIMLDFGGRDDGEASQKKSRLMDRDHDDSGRSENARTVHVSSTPRRQAEERTEESSKTASTDDLQELATVEAPILADEPSEAIQHSSPALSNPSKQPSPAKEQSSTPRSPPPPNSLTWQDSEITGHAPTDPLDDGYGINGIGFRPTPAVAYARAQKRTQQIQDWRNREAREARQRRSERRRGIGHEAPEGGDFRLSDQRRRVRFS